MTTENSYARQRQVAQRLHTDLTLNLNWRGTPQGTNYWRSVVVELEKLLRQPPPKKEVWFNEYHTGQIAYYDTHEQAVNAASGNASRVAVPMKEA